MMDNMRTKSPDPVRTCVICRNRFPKRLLTRHVCAEDGSGLVADPKQRATGRGFYVCDDAHCNQRFLKYGGWRTKCKGVQYDE